MQSVSRSIQDRSQNDLMDRTLCSSKDVGEEEEERVAETVFSRRSGGGPLLTLDVGKLAFVYCHGQRPPFAKTRLRAKQFRT